MARSILNGFTIAFAMALPGTALADAARTQAVTPFIASLMVPERGDYAYGDWNGLRTMPNSQWAQSPTFLDKPTAENDAMALSGRAMVAAKPVLVMATGARAGVFNFLVIDQTPFTTADDIANGLRAGRMTLSVARCPIRGAYPDARRWYRIAYPGKKPAFLIVAPVTGNIVGYRLNLDALAPMSEREATMLTDQCGGSPATATPATPAANVPIRNGTDAVVTMIDALVRPAAGAASIPWASVARIAPQGKWNALPPMKMTMPYTESGPDLNPQWLSGQATTPTTTIDLSASGTPAGANRFYFQNLRNTTPGNDFAALRARGYTITAVRCGKPYTQMTENWFSLTAPGKRTASLYRSLSRSTGALTASYVLRVDNGMPPMAQGQRAAPPTGCPG